MEEPLGDTVESKKALPTPFPNRRDGTTERTLRASRSQSLKTARFSQPRSRTPLDKSDCDLRPDGQPFGNGTREERRRVVSLRY
jgi:hypothetical protein